MRFTMGTVNGHFTNVHCERDIRSSSQTGRLLFPRHCAILHRALAGHLLIDSSLRTVSIFCADMTGTLRSLLQQSLDYAGLFPPATLPMAQASATFAHERSSQATTLLSRFVCPVSRLGEFVSATSPMPAPVRIAALLRGGKTAGEFLANLESDLAGLAAFTISAGPAFLADTLELKLPADTLDPLALRKTLAAIIALVGRQPGQARQIYLEIGPSPALTDQLALIAESADTLRSTTAIGLGYKLRTGGSDAASTLSIPQIAAALTATHLHRLPMKCTGGLHHPLYGTPAGADHAMHGFINLLVAAALTHCRQTPVDVLETVLTEAQAQAFVFEPETMHWGKFSLSADELTASRAQLLVSFGSCFADIPQLELLRLGWSK